MCFFFKIHFSSTLFLLLTYWVPFCQALWEKPFACRISFIFLQPCEVDAIMGSFKLPMRKLTLRQVPQKLCLQVPETQEMCWESSTELPITRPCAASGNEGTLKSEDLFSSSLLNLNWAQSTFASLGQIFISIHERRLSGFVFFMLPSFQTAGKTKSSIPVEPVMSFLGPVLNLHFIHSFHKFWASAMYREMCGIKR